MAGGQWLSKRPLDGEVWDPLSFQLQSVKVRIPTALAQNIPHSEGGMGGWGTRLRGTGWARSTFHSRESHGQPPLPQEPSLLISLG